MLSIVMNSSTHVSSFIENNDVRFAQVITY